MTRVRHDYIRGRDDFFRVLGEVLPIVRGLERRTPSFPPYVSIRRQLEAMERWTAAGRDPRREERRSIDMGRLASRELEPVDAAEQELAEKLSELAFYFKHWLDDEAWNALDDEDLATFFPDDDDPGDVR